MSNSNNFIGPSPYVPHMNDFTAQAKMSHSANCQAYKFGQDTGNQTTEMIHRSLARQTHPKPDAGHNEALHCLYQSNFNRNPTLRNYDIQVMNNMFTNNPTTLGNGGNSFSGGGNHHHNKAGTGVGSNGVAVAPTNGINRIGPMMHLR